MYQKNRGIKVLKICINSNKAALLLISQIIMELFHRNLW